MHLPNPEWIGLAFGVSEAALSWWRRSSSGVRHRDDRGSLRLIWIVTAIAMTVAMLCWRFLPQARVSMSLAWQVASLAIFVGGLLLRWYSILYLGKYFTVDVAVAADHKVIDTGPYRTIRHPSYTGALLAFLGLTLYMGNVASLIVVMTAVLFVFMRRIRIEEQVLQAGLGQSYTDYMQRTKRLIPFVY
ncbi:isoprenylcysteine carboxylmethyltransferase family protein [Povalibacter sp.]|uniref:methyltransferase family protein n=1 Tax=Povalibacter sp. TaxID=1962978 RepID=UPI002F41C04C